MMITADQLAVLGVNRDAQGRYLDDLNTVLPQFGIDTHLRVSHFFAQVLHESGCLRLTQENLNYSAKRLRQVFPRYFKTANPSDYAHRPERIGARVYANRMGNGNEASGDGWRYRGRGLIQLTGRSNYAAFGEWIGINVLENPDRVAEDLAVQSAVYYWSVNNLNKLADRDDIVAITRRINGGINGLAERRALLAKAKSVLRGVQFTQKKTQELRT